MKRGRFVLLNLLVALGLGTHPGWGQQPKPGGTLRLALAGDLTFFNANQGLAPGYFTFWVWNNIFDSLLTVTPPPELKIVPVSGGSNCLPPGRRKAFQLWFTKAPVSVHTS